MNNFMMLHFHEDFIELNMQEVDNEFLWYLYIDIPYVNGVCVFFEVYFILVEHINWLLREIFVYHITLCLAAPHSWLDYSKSDGNKSVELKASINCRVHVGSICNWEIQLILGHYES